jgi:subtilisin family serine protease
VSRAGLQQALQAPPAPGQLWQWRPDPAASAGTCRYLPAVSLTLRQGREVKALIDTGKKPTATVAILDRTAQYNPPVGFKSGTSMATPYVAGAAGLVWSAYPRCTNAEIRAALQKSALDLGPRGRDNQYGWGLVRAKAARDWLAKNPCWAYRG